MSEEDHHPTGERRGRDRDSGRDRSFSRSRSRSHERPNEHYDLNGHQTHDEGEANFSLYITNLDFKVHSFS